MRHLPDKWSVAKQFTHSATNNWARMALNTPAVFTDTSFATPDWTIGTNWTGGATLVHTAGSTAASTRVLPRGTVVAGQNYIVLATVSNYTAGSFIAYVGSAAPTVTPSNQIGYATAVSTFTAADSTDILRIVPSSLFDGTIDNVQVRNLSFASDGVTTVLDTLDVSYDGSGASFSPYDTYGMLHVAGRDFHWGVDVPWAAQTSFSFGRGLFSAGGGIHVSLQPANGAGVVGRISGMYRVMERNPDGVYGPPVVYNSGAGDGEDFSSRVLQAASAKIRPVIDRIDASWENIVIGGGSLTVDADSPSGWSTYVYEPGVGNPAMCHSFDFGNGGTSGLYGAVGAPIAIGMTLDNISSTRRYNVVVHNVHDV